MSNRISLAALAAASLLSAPQLARADYHIRSPDEIDYHEIEIEHNGAATFDHRPDQDNAQSYTVELGTGITPWYHPEIELDIGRNAGPEQPTQIQGFTWENTVRLTEPGEGWLDFGLYAEYSHVTLKGPGNADGVLFGPLLQKDVGRTTHTLNLFLEKQLGSGQDAHGLDFSYAWQSRWNVWRPLSPAIEIYGDAGIIDRLDPFKQQQLIAGPVAVGLYYLGDGLGKLKYEAGYLFGMTNASPAGTLRWKVEIEVPF